MSERTDAFSTSHAFELSALVDALRVARETAIDGGITANLHRRALDAWRAADEIDRQRQILGYRAAND